LGGKKADIRILECALRPRNDAIEYSISAVNFWTIDMEVHLLEPVYQQISVILGLSVTVLYWAP
jgi:hypothetical protein